MQTFIITKGNSGQTAIKYLQRLLVNAPQGLIRKQLRNKNITLNGKKISGEEKLKENDEIKIFMSDETILKFSGKENTDTEVFKSAFKKYGLPSVIYEDEHILLIDKPVGMLSQKAEPKDVSANEWLIGYLLNKEEISASSLSSFKPSVCNRLDRNTGGILTFGKTLFGTSYLNRMFKERSGHKFYRTIIAGNFKNKVDIKGYLSKDEGTNKVTISDKEMPGSSFIETSINPLRYSIKNDLTEAEVELITGKTHQIRAQLSYMGYPVLGDRKYGNNKINEKYNKEKGLKDQLLYAVRLEFPISPDYEAVSGKTFSIDKEKIFDSFF